MKRSLKTDALIAQKIFNMTWGKADDLDLDSNAWVDDKGVPWSMTELKFSTNIEMAWRVVKKVSCHSFKVVWEEDMGWKATFSFWNSKKRDFDNYTSYGYTAPQAICKAALKVYK